MKFNKKGFTLIELLVVIGILAVLLAITLIAINPARQFSQANDTKRRSDVNAILNAIHQYGADNRGNLAPLGLTSTPTEVGGRAGDATQVCAFLISRYLAALPVDPLINNGTPSDCSGSTYHSGYLVSVSAVNNRVTVEATAEIDPATNPITVTR